MLQRTIKNKVYITESVYNAGKVACFGWDPNNPATRYS